MHDLISILGVREPIEAQGAFIGLADRQTVDADGFHDQAPFAGDEPEQIFQFLWRKSVERHLNRERDGLRRIICLHPVFIFRVIRRFVRVVFRFLGCQWNFKRRRFCGFSEWFFRIGQFTVKPRAASASSRAGLPGPVTVPSRSIR